MAASKPNHIAETDLCAPLCDYLAERGYTVRCEVRNCDIVASRDDELLVIELKQSLNLALLAQAAARQRLTDSVYAAIPRPSNKRKWITQSRGVLLLLRRLEVGLVLVGTGGSEPAVEILFHPIPFQRRKHGRSRRAVIREVEMRSGDFNVGGSCRTKLVTAYRERAIHIACCLAERGPLSPKELRFLGTGDRTLSILRANSYAWFERIDRGVYAISPKGLSDLAQYPELAKRYRSLMRSSA